MSIGVAMREFIDDEGERHIDPFCFDEFGLIDRGVKAVRFLYGVTGAVGLIGAHRSPHSMQHHVYGCRICSYQCVPIVSIDELTALAGSKGIPFLSHG